MISGAPRGALVAAAALVATLVSSAARAAPAIDDSMGQLWASLDVERAAGFSAEADVAVAGVANAPEAELEAVARAAAGWVQARLARSAASPRPGATFEVSAREGALDAVARARGAEWLIVIEVGREGPGFRWVAELRAIDGGLWGSNAPRVVAAAGWSANAGEVAPRDPSGAPRFVGAPSRVATLPGRVLALRACEVGPSAELLFVLTRDALIAYAVEGEAIVARGRLELGGLEPAKERVREPFGGLTCAREVGGELALGSSELASGHLVRFVPRADAVGMSLARALPGIPFGVDAAGAFLTARPAGGKAELDRAVRVSTADAPIAALELIADPTRPSGARAFAVLADARLVTLSDDLATGTPLGASGVGITLIDGAVPTIVATSSTTRGPDRLHLVPIAASARSPHAQPLEVPGRVYATTSLGHAEALMVAAFQEATDETELLRVRFDRAPRPERAP